MRSILSLTAVLLLVGCTLPRWHGVKRPDARVTAVQMVEETAEGVRLLVTVELENPNDMPLPLERSHYTVRLANLEAVTFTERPVRTLPARGVQRVVLAAAVPTHGVRVSGADYRITGSMIYEPPGEIRQVLTESSVPLPSVSFSATGVLATTTEGR